MPIDDPNSAHNKAMQEMFNRAWGESAPDGYSIDPLAFAMGWGAVIWVVLSAVIIGIAA